MNIASLERFLDGIVPCLLCLVWAVDETVLADTSDGPRQENQQIFHCVLVSLRGVTRQSGYVGAVDSCYGTQLRLSAVNGRDRVHVCRRPARAPITRPDCSRADNSKLGAAFERVFTFGPTDGVRVVVAWTLIALCHARREIPTSDDMRKLEVDRRRASRASRSQKRGPRNSVCFGK